MSKKLFSLIESFYKDKKLLDKMIKNQKNYSDKKVFLKINRVITNLKNE